MFLIEFKLLVLSVHLHASGLISVDIMIGVNGARSFDTKVETIPEPHPSSRMKSGSRLKSC